MKIVDYKIVKPNSYFKDIHNINCKNTYGCELLLVTKESEKQYFGNLVGGLAFFDVVINKEDCRNPTQEELEMIDDGKMDLIEF